MMASAKLISDQAFRHSSVVANFIVKRLTGAVGVLIGSVPLTVFQLVPGNNEISRYQVSVQSCDLNYDNGVVNSFIEMPNYIDCALVGGQLYTHDAEKAEETLQFLSVSIKMLLEEMCIATNTEVEKKRRVKLWYKKDHLAFEGKVLPIKEGYLVTFEVYKECLEILKEYPFIPSHAASTHVQWICKGNCCFELQENLMMNFRIKIQLRYDECTHENEKAAIRIFCDEKVLKVTAAYPVPAFVLNHPVDSKCFGDSLKKLLEQGDNYLSLQI